MQWRCVFCVRCTPLSTRPKLSADSARLLGVCGSQASPARPRGLTRGNLSYTSSELGILPRPQEPNFLGPSPSRCEGDREKPESGESSLPKTGDTGTPEPERPPRQRLGRRISL
ncbi:rCG45669 [Rattus norvegicus]|uniref:RCG45669 n=1 Tax=Rattus norvegicus TaxID=10116 RepID=A6JTR3_RAT|nr:rCG45669 [Rattus norvegicus]